MFTLPPLPPKDYVLRDVLQNQLSVPEFTPVALPRITQANLGKFCAPIQYQEKEPLKDVKLDFSLNPQILDRWTDKARAFWVDRPGKDAYFLHDIFKKYTVEVVPSYDARFKHNERVFYRSFKYELDCAEEERLKKLEDKIEREENEEKEKLKKIEEEKITKIDTSMGIKSCRHESPFWWKKSDVGEDKSQKEISSTISKPVDMTTYDVSYNFRWQEEPDLIKTAKTDPCQHRLDMALIGMPFRSQACNWYYEHYPPPKLRFIHKRFA